jgi:hypothetical protein
MRCALLTPQVEEEHARTIEALSQSHKHQIERLSSQLAEQREAVHGLQAGLELGDGMIATLCSSHGQAT